MAKRRPSGDGMVRKRDDGRWEGRIVIGHKENGDSIFRYLYAGTQKELTAKLRQNIDIYQGIDLTEQSRMTLAEWLEQWLGHMSATLRPGTLEHYQRDMENHVVPFLGRQTPSGTTSFTPNSPPAFAWVKSAASCGRTSTTTQGRSASAALSTGKRMAGW